MIGNITPQLHVHIICRNKNDTFWPNTVWGHQCTPYDPEQKAQIVELLKKELICQK